MMAGRIEPGKPGTKQAGPQQEDQQRNGQYQAGIVSESGSYMEIQELVQRPLRSAAGTCDLPLRKSGRYQIFYSLIQSSVL